MDTKDDDFVVSTLVCSTKTNLLFFTTRGIAHTIKAYKLPETAANARGRPLINFIQLRQDETVATVMPVPSGNEAENKSLIFVTDHGDVRRNQASEFASVNRGGKIAMRLEDDNGVQLARLIAVLGCDDNDDIALATRWGKAARFPVTELRVFKGRSSTGVTGLKLASGDTVVSACILRHFDATSHERDAYLNGGSVKYRDENGIENILTLTSERNAQFQSKEQSLLTITSNGYGKRFSSYDFRTTGRGAHGVWSGQFTSATGYLVALLPVETADGLILVTNGGQSIRTRCSEIRVMGRTTRGVKVFDLPADQYIVDVARVPSED
jgi:DNA gyrase subunit A